MFSDPVNFIDPTGEIFWFVAIPVVVTAAAGYVAIIVQKRRNAEGRAKIDAYISGDPNRIKHIHDRISKTNELSKAIPVTAKLATIPGRGIPKNTKEAIIDTLNRLYHDAFLESQNSEKSKQCP